MNPEIDSVAMPRSVLVWLWSVYGMILAMVLIGGITRLTGSGLSMVEWKPLFGFLPPLDEAQWQDTFDKYKLFPQYLQVNSWMQLQDFKRIFFWEYFHRLFGRLIGLVFAVPFAWFVLRGQLQGGLRTRAAIAFVLGGLQGLLGWFMVKSGLVDMPAVSHLRLSAHLMLAFGVAQYVLWIILAGRRPLAGQPVSFSRVPRGVWALLVLVVIQIAYGAFVAGTRSGYMFATFPTFGGIWFPEALWLPRGAMHNLFYNPYTIQFVHRYLGVTILIAAAWLWLRDKQSATPANITRISKIIFGITTLQVLLGIITLLSGMNLAIAVTHQALAFILLSTITWQVYEWGRDEEETGERWHSVALAQE